MRKFFASRKPKTSIVVWYHPQGWSTGPIERRVSTLEEAEVEVTKLRNTVPYYSSVYVTVGKVYEFRDARYEEA